MIIIVRYHAGVYCLHEPATSINHTKDSPEDVLEFCRLMGFDPIWEV